MQHLKISILNLRRLTCCENETILQLEEGNQGHKIEQLPPQDPSKETEEEALVRGALKDLDILNWIPCGSVGHMIYHDNQVPRLLGLDTAPKVCYSIGARVSGLVETA
jgi:hypothetical protein